MSQLRSTMPAVVAFYPKEVIYLLDLMVEGTNPVGPRLWCIEYLLTLLCSEQRGGVTCISRDPARLSPTITAFCERIENGFPGDIRDAELEFHQAASLLGGSPDPSIVRQEARDLKTRLGINRFAPNIVRAIVSYNTQLRNLMLIREQEIRQSDESLGAALTADSAASTELGATAEESGISDSEGLRQIVDAFRRRLAGVQLGSSSAESIALNLETSDLEAMESEAFSHEPPDEQSGLITNAVAIGLMLRILPIIDEPLTELGLTPELLDKRWINELDKLFKEATRAKIAAGEYEDACALSETRTKYLYASLAEQSRNAMRVRKSKPDSSYAATASQELLDAVEVAHRATEAVIPPHTMIEEKSSEWNHERIARAAGMIGLLVVGIFAFVFFGSGEQAIQDLDRPQLVKVSKYLSSAYRDGEGSGPLMVGRVHVDWHRLNTVEKRVVANDMIKRVGDDGVKRLIVYDDNYRPVIQYASGQLRTLR